VDKELGQHEFIDATAKWGRDFVEVLNPLKENEILRVYHEPSQREWQSLTDDEIFGIFGTYVGDADYNHKQLLLDAKRIEQALKEKNGL
jgi:hypothetical protein